MSINPGIKALSNPTLKLDNPGTLQLAKPETRLLAKRIIVASVGSPVQFPQGRVVGNEIRLSTRANTGTVYIGDGETTVKDGVLRFGIPKDSNIPYRVSKGFELSRLWVDADTDTDAIEVICEIHSK